VRNLLFNLINRSMKNTFQRKANFCLAGIASFVSIIFFAGSGCNKNDSAPTTSPTTTRYDEVKLVADQSSAGAAQTDPSLVNPWGIAIGGSGAFWLSANGAGKSTIYDRTGATLLAAITVPATGAVTGGPTGVVFNNTTDFKIALTGETGKFIFATVQGTIAAWSSAGVAITVADRSSANAAYTGLTMASDAGANFLYAADFRNARIDVYDKSFALVSGKSFSDSSLPAGYAPFNIRSLCMQSKTQPKPRKKTVRVMAILMFLILTVLFQAVLLHRVRLTHHGELPWPRLALAFRKTHCW